MGKPTGKKKKADPSKRHDAQSKPAKGLDRASKAFDEDTAVFITMSQELKEEGSKLFQKRDHEGAMLKYEKALKLLPKNHIDVANLRTNMATCYMQVGIGEYPRAINECNLALEVAPKYSKALLKRAKCFEAVNRLDLAWRDVRLVLSMEPSNTNALEIADSVKRGMEEKGIKVEEIEIGLSSKDVESVGSSGSRKVRKENRVGRENSSSSKKKKKGVRIEVTKHVEERKVEDRLNPKDKENQVEDRLNAQEYKSKPEDKEVVKEKIHVKEDKGVTRTAKLVFGDDIRWAQLPSNCSMLLIRDIVRDRFPNLKGALIKCRDQEGDLITITTVEELRRAEASCNPQGSLRLYIAEVDPDQEPVYDCCEEIEIPVAEKRRNRDVKYEEAGKDGEMEAGSTCVENWILHFAQLFKSNVGFDSDSYWELHDTGMKLYSEAVEDTLTSEEAQELFDMASEKFQEMAALALFNWGNVHMSKARKWVPVSEENANESMVTHIESAYEWAQNEYKKAQTRYQEALKIKPDFYEGHLALGQQQFEQARVCWHYSLGKKIDLEVDSYQDVIELYNKAEDNMEAGVHIWEEMEERRLNGLSKEDKYKTQLQKMGLDGLLNDIPADEASEKAAIMRSQIYILWGKLLYERSIVEFKLGLPTWEECLEVAVENFELAGASHTDIAVMIKNHCANQTTQEGLGFKIDEIVQAWHEMYDAKRWQTGVLSFRLEPLFRRRVPILHNILEHTRLC